MDACQFEWRSCEGESLVCCQNVLWLGWWAAAAYAGQFHFVQKESIQKQPKDAQLCLIFVIIYVYYALSRLVIKFITLLILVVLINDYWILIYE